MKIGLKLSMAALAATMFSAAPAAAKQCKDETISATSREYISRSLGAFPGSWAAWRKEVKQQFGNGWQAWRRAEDRKIKCEQTENLSGRKRWTCTRTARPCAPGTASAGNNTGSNSGSGSDAGDSDITYVPIDRVLRRGMKNDQVKTLQFLLGEAGYDVEIDGDFGRGTEKALREFQRKSDLKVDGRAGPDTVEALTS